MSSFRRVAISRIRGPCSDPSREGIYPHDQGKSTKAVWPGSKFDVADIETPIWPRKSIAFGLRCAATLGFGSQTVFRGAGQASAEIATSEGRDE